METLDRESIILKITELKEPITDFQQQKIAAETTLRSLQERLAADFDKRDWQDAFEPLRKHADTPISPMLWNVPDQATAHMCGFSSAARLLL
jgi:hypothetical protein